MSAGLVRSYRARMAACLGFSTEAAASLGSHTRLSPAERGKASGQPTVLPALQPRRLQMLLVNRRYSAGRSILNIDEVREALHRRFGSIADVPLREMEGLSLRCVQRECCTPAVQAMLRCRCAAAAGGGAVAWEQKHSSLPVPPWPRGSCGIVVYVPRQRCSKHGSLPAPVVVHAGSRP